jgi:uncharacterized protein (DUF433 family)
MSRRSARQYSWGSHMAKVYPLQDEKRLIAEHIDTSWPPAEARLKRAGVSVWSLIGYLRAFGGDVAQARGAFALSAEEMEAALAYYQRHKKYIDARLLLNSD